MSSSADFISRFRSDPAFRLHAEREPLAALRSMGIAVPAGVSIDFLENASHAVDCLFDRPPAHADDVIDDALLDGVAGGLLVSNNAAALTAQRLVANLMAALGEDAQRQAQGYVTNQRP